MPIYQYACPDCGNRFELKQKFTDDPVRKCPKCGRVHVYRVVGQVAVTFKGTGWYITDSRSSTEKKTLEHRPKEKEAATASGNGTSEGTAASTTAATASTEKVPAKPAEPAAKNESGHAKQV